MRQFYEMFASIEKVGAMLFFIAFVQAELFWILEKGNPDPTFRNKPFQGFFLVLLYSYKMTIGDFGQIADSFEESSEYMVLYSIIFVFFTIMSLLILLNMIIAIMSGKLEEVLEDEQAVIQRERLIKCIESHHRLPNYIKKRFSEYTHLYLVNVDPQEDVEGVADSAGASLAASGQSQDSASQDQLLIKV